MKTSRISIKWIEIICAYDSHIYSMLNYLIFKLIEHHLEIS